MERASWEPVIQAHSKGEHQNYPREFCPDCQNERLAREAEWAIRNHERLARGE